MPLDFAPAWAQKFRVLIPYHPGFGPSADDGAITEIHDYVLHYVELFDTLGLAKVRLVGQSMGGFIATKLAVEHGHRVEKLVLACPIGLPVPAKHATVNFLAVPPQDLPALLAHDPMTVVKHLPTGEPSGAFIGERTKEAITAGRVLGGGTGTFDAKLPRYLHRLTMPTLLVWGDQDTIVSRADQEVTCGGIRQARLIVHAGAGRSLSEASLRAMLEREGIRVAIVSFADHFVEYAAGDDD